MSLLSWHSVLLVLLLLQQSESSAAATPSGLAQLLACSFSCPSSSGIIAVESVFSSRKGNAFITYFLEFVKLSAVFPLANPVVLFSKPRVFRGVVYVCFPVHVCVPLCPVSGASAPNFDWGGGGRVTPVTH